MFFSDFYFATVIFRTRARGARLIALIVVLCGERPYIKNLLSPFWFLSRTHSLRDPAHWGRKTEIDGRLVPPGKDDWLFAE